MDRRYFVKGAAAVMATPSIMSACQKRKPPDILLNPGDTSSPLVIDTHAHCFNADDLPVGGFISRVAVNEIDSSALRFLATAFAPVLEFIGWAAAPSAKKEIRLLDDYLSQPSDASRDRARDR